MSQESENEREYRRREAYISDNLTTLLWDQGYTPFYSSDGPLTDKDSPHVIALDRGGVWVFHPMVDYGISEMYLTEESETLDETRENVHKHSSVFANERVYDCGFAIFSLDEQQWYYVPYSIEVIDDVTEHKRLVEVV